MRALGILLELSGWLIAMASIALLHTDGERLVFAICGVGVQCLGMGTLAYAYQSSAKRASAA